jgi:hypothetical protein
MSGSIITLRSGRQVAEGGWVGRGIQGQATPERVGRWGGCIKNEFRGTGVHAAFRGTLTRIFLAHIKMGAPS